MVNKKFLLIGVFIFTLFFVSADNIIVSNITDSENNSISITRYVYGINGLVASIDKSGVEYYHSDRIFSNRLITDLFGE
ncbi:hypothetical protein HOD61_01020, partial [archaeon]|nr:hypothetical protein [archaeon]